MAAYGALFLRVPSGRLDEAVEVLVHGQLSNGHGHLRLYTIVSSHRLSAVRQQVVCLLVRYRVIDRPKLIPSFLAASITRSYVTYHPDLEVLALIFATCMGGQFVLFSNLHHSRIYLGHAVSLYGILSACRRRLLCKVVLNSLVSAFLIMA